MGIFSKGRRVLVVVYKYGNPHSRGFLISEYVDEPCHPTLTTTETSEKELFLPRNTFQNLRKG